MGGASKVAVIAPTAGRASTAAAPCLASVMLVIDVQRWLARNTTAAVESWLAQNAQRRMWKLGSLPPLMLALGQHWERLPPAALPVSY